MGTTIARRYLGTIWSLIALGTLGTYADIVRQKGTVEGKDWGLAVAGLCIGLGLLFYDRFRPSDDQSEDPPADEAEKKN
jgi:hypothetical protein